MTLISAVSEKLTANGAASGGNTRLTAFSRTSRSRLKYQKALFLTMGPPAPKPQTVLPLSGFSSPCCSRK